MTSHKKRELVQWQSYEANRNYPDATLTLDSTRYARHLRTIARTMASQNFSILCVDDDPSILRMLQRILASNEYSIVTAGDGLEALALLQDNPFAFQIVTTDLRMPHLDGFGLIELARAAGYVGAWLVYAALISPHDRQRLVELGVNRIVNKPSSPADLLDVLEEVQSSS